MNYTSKLLEESVEALASLPSIGKKSALRLVLHLLKEEKAKSHRIGKALIDLVDKVQYCSKCFCISDSELCEICSSSSRDRETICVVESIRDVMAIEDTGQFNGLYHILGGIISPIEGIGPNDLNIDPLISRIKQGEAKELIMAVSPNIEGETTIYYISKLISNLDIKVSTIARGVSFGGELEYADELTLGRSIATRILYKTVN